MWKSRVVYSLLIAFGLVLSSSGIDAQEVPDEKWADKQDQVDLPALFQAAAQDLNAEDFKAAAAKFKKYTKAKTDNGQAWFLLAYALHMDGQIDEAIPVHEKATQFADFKSTALYNLGCAYSIKKDAEKSIDYLHQALDAGFNQLDMFETDGDLENVRKSKGFSAIAARARNGGKRMEQEPKKASAKQPDAKALVGKWAVTSGTRQGDEIDAERLPPEIVFTEKDVTMPAGNETFVMSYKIVSADKNSIAIDFKIESGPAPEGTAKGILKLDGDKAKLCYDPTGASRPEEFKTTAENGFFMFVMEKKAEKFDATKLMGKWQVTEGVRAGEEVAAERLEMAVITFEKNKITIPAGDDEFVMSFTINADETPIEIDMKIDSGPAPEGSAAVGILKLKGDTFMLCYNAVGGDRPKKFESTEQNGCFLFVMKPVEK